MRGFCARPLAPPETEEQNGRDAARQNFQRGKLIVVPPAASGEIFSRSASARV